MGFNDLMTSDMRLQMLRYLNEGGYSQNESILNDLVKRGGHNVGRDKVRTELAWLQEQGLVGLDDSAGFYVATITQRGVDVATGATVVPGIKRPGPPRIGGENWLEH